MLAINPGAPLYVTMTINGGTRFHNQLTEGLRTNPQWIHCINTPQQRRWNAKVLLYSTTVHQTTGWTWIGRFDHWQKYIICVYCKPKLFSCINIFGDKSENQNTKINRLKADDITWHRLIPLHRPSENRCREIWNTFIKGLVYITDLMTRSLS